MASGVGQPLRIGVAGQGRVGAFHVERLSLRDDARVVAICDPAPRPADQSDPQWPTFVADDSLDLVLIATPPETHTTLIQEALAAGRDVAVEPPLGLTVADADRLGEAARAAGRFLGVVHRARSDDDFRVASQLVASGALDRPTTFRLTEWAFGARDSVRLTRRMAQRLDQLLQLAGDDPQSIFARCRTADESHSAEMAWIVAVTFRGGATALLDVDTASPAALRTGWVVSGPRAACQNFQHVRVTDDGEVFGVPLVPPVISSDRFYDDLFAERRDRDPAAQARSLREARRVVALLEAMHISDATGQTVTLDNLI